MARKSRGGSGTAGHDTDRNRDERSAAPGASAVYLAFWVVERDAHLRRSVRERLEPPEGPGTALAGHTSSESAASDWHRLEPCRPDLLFHAEEHESQVRPDGVEVAGGLGHREAIQ